ncbi:hypothetical protein [Bernardetia sp.]|uniref:hypothetical protein n=1 Tax=Bernardetia sp. TaxID=1937974 RepID=UPI0025C0DD49|nr:hypothetical protein [Bernardetia sp.]
MFDFDFRFLDAKNKPTSFFDKQGSIEEEGIYFDGEMLAFSEIQEVVRYRNRLSIIIKAGARTAVDEFLLPHFNGFMIRVEEEEAFDIKSMIDRRYTELQVEERKKELKAQDELHNFRKSECPTCRSSIDLSYVRPTRYIFCRYCDTIFNKHGNYTDLNDYKICPVCNYYNRVQVTPKVELYFYGKEDKASVFESTFQCDSCTERELRPRFWKNLPFVVGAIADFIAKNKIETDIDSSYAELTKANRLGYLGRVDEAKPLYESMFLYVKDQPGVLYDFGKAYLDSALLLLEDEEFTGDEAALPYIKEAVHWLSRCLKMCANYEPAIKLFEDNEELEYEIEDDEYEDEYE